jgi:predicted Zn-dependent peptidase
MKKLAIVLVLLMAMSTIALADFDFSKIKNKVSEFTLPNGLKFILVEDHSVPIATFVTYANVGGSDERIGIWGVSHFLEHMAFKGTSEVGTNNLNAERKVMQKMDAVFAKILAENDSLNPDKEKIKKLEEEMKKLQDEHAKYVIPNHFTDILKQNGVTGMNAGTSKDATRYFYSLPSNKAELWAYLESARFTDPVFREFHKERQVIKEERRVRTENSPIGKLIEELNAVAFKDHPYHVSGIGPMSNLNHISRAEMMAYFRANYTAKNMIIGVAGDVTPAQLKKLAKKYFSKLPAGRKNTMVFTNETKQLGEKTVTIFEDSQPWVIVAYHAPAITHPDFIKFNVLNRLITSGRSSRLKKKMEIDKKSALAVGSFIGFPGDKYPCLYLMLALPNSGHTTDEMIKGFDEEIEKIKKEGVSEEELKSAKTREKVSIIRGMGSGTGLLMQLLSYEVKTGSWQTAFEELGAIDKITVKDIQGIVKTYLTRGNRSIGRIEKKEKEDKEEVKK